MTENFSSEGGGPVDLLAETEDLYRQAAEDLARARRGLRQGKLDEAKLALQAVKDLKLAFQIVMDERTRVEKLRRQVAGVAHDHVLDFDAARVEIGRRLACLRDAGGGG
jgi:HEPN domain-containing protein